MLLIHDAPGGKEIWAAMSEAERAAEEAEYRDLIRSMPAISTDQKARLATKQAANPAGPRRASVMFTT